MMARATIKTSCIPDPTRFKDGMRKAFRFIRRIETRLGRWLCNRDIHNWRHTSRILCGSVVSARKCLRCETVKYN